VFLDKACVINFWCNLLTGRVHLQMVALSAGEVVMQRQSILVSSLITVVDCKAEYILHYLVCLSSSSQCASLCSRPFVCGTT